MCEGTPINTWTASIYSACKTSRNITLVLMVLRNPNNDFAPTKGKARLLVHLRFIHKTPMRQSLLQLLLFRSKRSSVRHLQTIGPLVVIVANQLHCSFRGNGAWEQALAYPWWAEKTCKENILAASSARTKLHRWFIGLQLSSGILSLERRRLRLNCMKSPLASSHAL